ncbi:MAG: MBL fold metallo-hydrolase [Candidatus Aminicenantes bacterium]|nr:MBL fold metallo-hydrolase [Candidatus Aminicenantes bacterium]
MKIKKVEEIAANVFVINDSMFPIYVIRGQKKIMVDASILAKGDEIERNLAEIMGNDKVDTLLLTHSHYDHTGACAYLQAKQHFNIIASQRTMEILQNPKAIEFIDKLNQEFKRLLNQDNALRVTMPENISAVHEGDAIPVGENRWLQVYETPGHTRCSISFLLLPENILFPGDAAGVMEKNGLVKPLFLSGFSPYIGSLEKISRLNPEILALPHNRIIRGRKNVKDFFDRSQQETVKLKETISRELQASSDFAAIGEKLLDLEYPLPTIAGPREALLINLTAMVKVIFHEFIKKIE